MGTMVPISEFLPTPRGHDFELSLVSRPRRHRLPHDCSHGKPATPTIQCHEDPGYYPRATLHFLASSRYKSGWSGHFQPPVRPRNYPIRLPDMVRATFGNHTQADRVIGLPGGLPFSVRLHHVSIRQFNHYRCFYTTATTKPSPDEGRQVLF